MKAFPLAAEHRWGSARDMFTTFLKLEPHLLEILKEIDQEELAPSNEEWEEIRIVYNVPSLPATCF